MPLTTPPFRTSLLTANGVPFGTGNGEIQTTRDWWLYWNQLTGQGNSNSKLATAGTHADRPMPDGMPDGALYYENDRGVLYAHTIGVWQYVAGVMWGTLSPDQRPADLGTHDAGFNFRTIVAPAREFIWSQAEWIEVTPVQYGPHAARPDPATIVEGALYVEGDRGGVIYQVENPAGTPLWQYLAGTMWGTLVPDQRPADLGVHDAGFDFRTTTSPPREFIWNQTAWIEITALRYGTHAQRLATTAATVWTGMAWMETDRDNVVYEVQNVAGSPAWVYVTGTMADSFSNLPGDLGANDVNFTFATSDTYEIYRWAGSTWVNQTPANLGLLARSTANLTLTPTAAAIPGATLTLTRSGRYLITGFFTFNINDAGVPMRAGLSVNGADQGSLVILTGPVGAFLAASQQWSYVAAAGAVANLMASKDSGAGGSVAQAGYTSISALWLGP